ncbi:MAG: RNA polymerase sporulation sigma factor SigH, partial [Oscillospiraceae bacterium]|nr:RNA polymerase sporulation sigma factor SigH [Oscillospiraceae bacterium]
MTDYNEMQDDELVELAQTGDDTALETVLLRYKPLVHKKSQPYYLAGGDDDDIVQEGLIGLYKAVMDFDKTKFPLFKVFAGVCIERRIISAVKKASRKKHSPLNSYVSLSSSEFDEDGGTVVKGVPSGGQEVNPEQIVLDRERVSGLEGIISGALSEFERRVLLCHLNGKSYKETAVQLGRDAKAVDNAMQRIKKKLENLV